MESRDRKRAGEDLERTAKRRGKVGSAGMGNDSANSSTYLLLALTIDHIIVDEPTHLMYHQHLTTLLDSCTTLDHLQQMVTRIEIRARELQMADNSQRAVDAISHAWCERAANVLTDMVLNEDMLAEIIAGVAKMKVDTGFNVEVFLGALQDKIGLDDTSGTRTSRGYGMASTSASAAQGHDTRRNAEIEMVDAVDVQPSRSRPQDSMGAAAPQASHERGKATGSGSVAQGHILRRTSEIEMGLGTVAQGVDLYWCRRTLLKVSREEVKGLMQQLFHSGRDVYIVNHIALAELEAHDALQSLDLQQLRHSAARAWAGETSKETDRYGVRHEMLVEGKAYVLSPTDCNNKRQRRRDEYGLI
ncbi:hypothetical protein LTR17_011139, partial [Elasticomyces elasticus]